MFVELMNDMVQQIDMNEIELEEAMSPPLAVRRNRPGTSAKDWCKWSDQGLDEMESTLAVQQVSLIFRTCLFFGSIALLFNQVYSAAYKKRSQSSGRDTRIAGSTRREHLEV